MKKIYLTLASFGFIVSALSGAVACGDGASAEAAHAIEQAQDFRSQFSGLAPPPADTLERTFVTDRVQAMAKLGDTVYLSGPGYVGQRGGTWLALDEAGAVDKSFPEIGGGETYVSIPDGEGGHYVGGSFRRAGKNAVQGLVRVKADKSLDARFFPTILGSVWALALEGNTLYVGGDFEVVDGQARLALAAFDVSSGRLLEWNPTLRQVRHSQWRKAVARSIVVANGRVLVGGGFDQVGSTVRVTRGNLAAFDAETGAALPLAPDIFEVPRDLDEEDSAFPGLVNRLALAGSKLYFGGHFSFVGAASRKAIAVVDVETGRLLDFDAQLENSRYILDMLLVGERLYVAGSFWAFAGEPREHLASLRVTDDSLLDWKPTGISPDALAATDSKIVVAGYVPSRVAGFSAIVAAVDAESGERSGKEVLLQGRANAVAADGGRTFVAGPSSAGGQPRQGLAAIDLTSRRATAWNPSVDWAPQRLLATRSSIYAAGLFTAVNGGNGRPYLVALDPDTGATMPGFTPKPDGFVVGMALSGSSLYVAGRFSSLGKVQRRCLAELNAVTGSPTSWKPNTGQLDYVFDVAVSENNVYALGPESGELVLARFDRRTGARLLASRFTSDFPQYGPWGSLAIVGSALYIAGKFSAVDGQLRDGLAALDAESAALLPFAPRMERWPPTASNPLMVWIAGTGADKLYVSGYFTAIDGIKREGFAALALPSGQVSDLNPDIFQGSSVLATIESEDGIDIGGSFTTVGDRSQSGYAHLRP